MFPNCFIHFRPDNPGSTGTLRGELKPFKRFKIPLPSNNPMKPSKPQKSSDISHFSNTYSGLHDNK